MQTWHEGWTTEALRVLKPGGHLLAFGGTRTFHRLACAVEDAGFEIRDSLCWMYGSGFPKSLDVSKAIDKTAGAERTLQVNERWAKRYPQGPGGNLRGVGRSEHFNQCKRITGGPLLTSAPTTDDAKRWNGWGTAMKPSWEPVIVARKPLIGTVAQNVLEHGTGALNIDGCRVGTDRLPEIRAGQARLGTFERSDMVTPERIGRWPPNLLLQHADGCRQVGEKRVETGTAHRTRGGGNTFGGSIAKPPLDDLTYADADGKETVAAWICEPGCPVKELDAQSGERTSGSRNAGEYGGLGYQGWTDVPMPAINGDTGTASRFYPQFQYVPKASRQERERGLDGVRLVRYVDPSWVNEALNQALPAATATSVAKATAASTIVTSDESVWSMCWCGSLTTDPYHPAITSTIEMVTSSITESTTSRSSPRPHTNGCIAAVCGEVANGGSLAESAASSSPWAQRIGISAKRDGRSTDDVVPATSVKSWLTSEPEGRHGVANSHPT
jgi:hypothetical protein